MNLAELVLLEFWSGASPASAPAPPATFRALALTWSNTTTQAVRWSTTVATRTNLFVYKGENVTLNFTPATTQTPVDLTGKTLVFSVRRYPNDLDALVTITTTSSDEGVLAVTSASTGTYSVDLTSLATGTTLGVGQFAWDVWITDAGFEAELAGGTLIVQPSARTGD